MQDARQSPSLMNGGEILDAVIADATSLAAGKLAHRRIAIGMNHSLGLLPQVNGSWLDTVLAVAQLADMIPAALLTVFTPEGLEPFALQRYCRMASEQQQCPLPTHASLLQIFGIIGVEPVFLADAVEVAAVNGAVDRPSF